MLPTSMTDFKMKSPEETANFQQNIDANTIMKIYGYWPGQTARVYLIIFCHFLLSVFSVSKPKSPLPKVLLEDSVR